MTFDSNRFATLLKTELRANPKQYLGAPLITLAIIGGLILWNIFRTFISRSPYNSAADMLETMSWIGLGIGICVICAGGMFSNMKTRPMRINVFMLPASNFEKFLVRWILFIPLALLVYFVGLLFIDALQFVLARMLMQSNAVFVSPDKIFSIGWPFMMLMLCLQSLFCLGSSIWPKNSELKTSLWLFAINIGSSLLYSFLLSEIIPIIDFRGALLESVRTIPLIDAVWPYNADTIVNVVLIALTIIFCAVNYTIAYFRFKENEIIDRW